MRKLIWIMALAAILVSCKSKGSRQPELIAEGESDSLYMVNDSTVGDMQTFYYEGVMPIDSGGVQGTFQLTMQSTDEDANGYYYLTTTYNGAGGTVNRKTDRGEKAVLKGIPGDSTVIIYELISLAGNPQINLQARNDSTLHKVDENYKRVAPASRNQLSLKSKK